MTSQKTRSEAPLRFGSLFSGVGGFDLGLEAAGWECAFQVEIDPFCTKVLERHWPNVRRHRDITTVDAHALGVARATAAPGRRDESDAPGADEGRRGAPDGGAIDLLCGGFPCQDLSVAGRRAGLAGVRSGLFFEFVRLARELRPRWLLLENVPGLLSSNGGRDFRTVLSALGDAGYGVGWRVLDSRWFGVPQRRRRVFLVGRLGAPCPYAVLFEPPGVLGHLEESADEGEDVAGSLTGVSPGGGWRIGADEAAARQLVAVPDDGAASRTISTRQSRDDADTQTFVTDAATVRRLTPTECERLMGLPDGHTCLCGVEPYSTRDCRCPDGPRYAACGNAVVTNVVTWIGRRLLTQHNGT